MNEQVTRPDLTDDLTRPEHHDAVAVAREQFAHGLLETLHRDSAAARERRIERLMARLEASIPMRVAPAPARAANPWRLVPRRLMTGLAAAVALVAVTLLGLPTERSAMAMVQDSLKASTTVGDRRYDIRVTPPRQTEAQAVPIGRLDVRDREHVVVSMTSPMGDTVVRGRNGSEEWAVLPDGTIDRFPPRRMLPPWVDFGTSTVLLASVDELLSTLEKSYDLKRGTAEAPPGGTGPACDRITAVHRGASPEPNRMELWLDPQSRVVRRMELHWKPRPMQPGGPGMGPRPGGGEGMDRGPDEGPRPGMGEGRPPLPPRRGPGPEGRPGRVGPGPEVGPGPDDGAPLDEGRPMRPPPDGPRNRPEGGPPPAPEDRPEGDGPGMGPRRRPGPPPGGARDEGGPVRGDDRAGGPPPDREFMRPGNGPGDRGPRDGGPRRPRPQFLGGPPDFDRGRQPPPPRTLVFELVEGGAFAEGWFEPGAHAPKGGDTPKP